jgi:endonuclease/exonuclease/phosphatase (EEP) superfamily protein YafD
MFVTSQFARDKLTAMVALVMGMLMISRFACVVSVALSFSLALCLLTSIDSHAQDVPGIEICTVEKTMERRTSCLQSNVDFLQKTIARLAADHQQRLDAAYRQTEALKATVIALQKVVDDLQAVHKKTIEDQKKKTDAPTARDGAPAAKDGAK